MSKSCSDIVDGGATRDDGVGEAAPGQHASDGSVAGVEQFSEVAVGEQSTLLVSLLAEAERLVQQSLGSGPAIDPLLHVLRGGEVEEDRDSSVSAIRWRWAGGLLTLTAIHSAWPWVRCSWGRMCLDITSRIISAHN